MRGLLAVFVLLCLALPFQAARGETANETVRAEGHAFDVAGAQAAMGAETGTSTRSILVASGYCVVVVLASLLGGWLPLIVRPTHTRLQISMSFCGGLMLGIGLLHMLPHAFAQLDSLDRSVWWMMLGLLTMFFLIRAFHFHQHESAETREIAQVQPPALEPKTAAAAPRKSASHDHSHPHPADRLSWIGVVVGLGIHTMIDGMALAAGVQAEAAEHGGWLPGLGIFLAIVLHKPLDTVPIAILMRSGSASPRLTHVVNAGFAALCPVGMGLFFFGLRLTGQQSALVGCALAFSAGVFVCIALSDLLPELEFHTHDRFKLSLALLIGVAIAYAIGFIEPEHAHDPDGGHRHAAEQTHPGSEHPPARRGGAD